MQQSYAAPDVPDTLRQRVAELAVLNHQRQVMQPIIRAHWPRIALGVTLCSLMTVGAVAWPRLHAVLLLRQMRFAMQNLQTAHIVTWHWAGRFTRHKQIEMFYNNGQWHIEKSYGNWIYEIHENLRAPEHSTALEEVFRPPISTP